MHIAESVGQKPAKSLDATVRSRSRRTLPDPPLRRLIRERAALSQSELAEVLGVHASAVCRWESGARQPRGDLMEAYAGLLRRLAREVL